MLYYNHVAQLVNSTRILYLRRNKKLLTTILREFARRSEQPGGGGGGGGSSVGRARNSWSAGRGFDLSARIKLSRIMQKELLLVALGVSTSEDFKIKMS